MKILKFGGSSVANADTIKQVIQIILQSSKKRGDMVIVVSAFGGVTDKLIQLDSLASKRDHYQALLQELCEKHSHVIKELIVPEKQEKVLTEVTKGYKELTDVLKGISLLGELSPRSLDKVMSFGEQLSAYIIAQAIESQGVACRFVDARTIIKTDDNFGSAKVEIQKTYELISKYFEDAFELSMMGGFVASTNDGITTTLGRGGSDYTASLVGAALDASVIEIWTDVDGVMTADPRKAGNAFPLPEISYEEASELAHFGAKVIHPKSMQPARLKGIPLHIKNTFNPEGRGTRMSNEKSRQDFLVKGISSLSNVSLLRIQSNNSKSIGEIAARLFDVLARYEIEILLTTQASHEEALSIAVSKQHAQKAKTAIEKNFALELKARQMLPISVEEKLSIVAVVGKQMKGVPGIAGSLLSTLGDNKINVAAIAQGSSELNISVVINSKDETKALQVIHEAFFGRGDKAINLFLVGTGLIGSTLLKQIEEQRIPIRICGLANSHFMVVDKRGIALKNWQQEFSEGKSAELQTLIKQMIELNLPQSVFVDCTASEEVASVYEGIIEAGIAVVTPNKKANSGSFRQYQALKDLAQKKHVPFLYETNVGAGLPIIHTIQSLVVSGDEIIKIEAVLSGSLSYIFNTFSENDTPFSAVVRDAQDKGFTEPDPRDDLGGMDVARKILILAREIGLDMELEQVDIKPLLLEEHFAVESVDAFFKELEKCDGDFEKRKLEAQKAHRALRYIATLEDGKAQISLQEVDENHPSYQLSGSDNIILLTTKRYTTTPLVIKGPGAGAEVTAGGVLSDIISIKGCRTRTISNVYGKAQ